MVDGEIANNIHTHKRHTVQKIYGEKVTCW